MTLLRVRATPLESGPGRSGRQWRADLEAHDRATGWQAPLASLTVALRVGEQKPAYWFYLGTRVHSAPALGLHRRDRMLVLGSDFTGASQCQDVWWKPDLEPHEAAGMLTCLLRGVLALAPSMDIGDGDGDRTAVIVALPGVTEAGRSPFWDSFGRHFYDGDRQDAIARLGIEDWRSGIASLLPQQPVLVSLLAPSGQSSLECAAAQYAPLEAALKAARFAPSGHVSIDDGGPVYRFDPDDRDGNVPHRIEVVEQSIRATPHWLVDATQKVAVFAPCSAKEGVIAVHADIAQALWGGFGATSVVLVPE